MCTQVKHIVKIEDQRRNLLAGTMAKSKVESSLDEALTQRGSQKKKQPWTCNDFYLCYRDSLLRLWDAWCLCMSYVFWHCQHSSSQRKVARRLIWSLFSLCISFRIHIKHSPPCVQRCNWNFHVASKNSASAAAAACVLYYGYPYCTCIKLAFLSVTDIHTQNEWISCLALRRSIGNETERLLSIDLHIWLTVLGAMVKQWPW